MASLICWIVLKASNLGLGGGKDLELILGGCSSGSSLHIKTLQNLTSFRWNFSMKIETNQEQIYKLKRPQLCVLFFFSSYRSIFKKIFHWRSHVSVALYLNVLLRIACWCLHLWVDSLLTLHHQQHQNKNIRCSDCEQCWFHNLLAHLQCDNLEQSSISWSDCRPPKLVHVAPVTTIVWRC